MSGYRDFNSNMNQLIEILKKILGDFPFDGHSGPFTFKKNHSGNIHVNFCFFNFMEMLPEDFDDYEEVYETESAEESFPKASLNDLDPLDIDFLKRNGIVF